LGYYNKFSEQVISESTGEDEGENMDGVRERTVAGLIPKPQNKVNSSCTVAIQFLTANVA
jgi:hypothetical protein